MLKATWAAGEILTAADFNTVSAEVNTNGGFTTTTTAAGTTTLTLTSTSIQQFTGTLTQTVVLPTTGVIAGMQWKIINNSTGAVTVQSSGANTITIVTAGTEATFIALVATPTAAAHWSSAAPTGGSSVPTFTTTVSSATTVTLTTASNEIQQFTGSSAQTVVLPTTSIVAGRQFTIINNSTGLLTMQSSSGATVHVLAPGTESLLTALVATPTTAAHWEDSLFATSYAAGKSLTVNNTLTLAGTDATTMTFPGTSDTVVTLAAAQALSSKTLTAPTVTDYTESVVAIGTVTTARTISLTSGTVQTATLTASTECTFTMPTATAGKSFVLLLKQDATTGGGTATFTGVKFSGGGAPVVTSTAGKMDIFTFVSDGTNWYGTFAQNFVL